MGKTTLVGATSVPVVQVRGFGKHYGKQMAVDSIDLIIQKGDIYGLIGPDGAGKSSLMKAIAGVLSYERGSVDVFGIRIDSEAAAEKIKARIGFMPQGLGLNLYAQLSVEENIDFFAQLRGVAADLLIERKHKLLAMTRLDQFLDRPVKQLSGGMKQKLGLVCTLIHAPELVILDEPTTGVDPVSRRDFWAILAELLRDQGITALVSTAYMDEAARFFRLSLMYNGQILAEGDPDKVRKMVSGCLVKVKVKPQIEALNRLKAQSLQVEAVGSTLRIFVSTESIEDAIKQIKTSLEGLIISEIHAGETTLEDTFVALMKQGHLTNEPIILKENTALNSTFNNNFNNKIAIDAQGLIRNFGDFRAVDNVSFQVLQGEIFGLLGANGAGKTTVIKMLTGILQPTEGKGHVAGVDMRHALQTLKECIGYVSQAFSLYQDMTVVENIRLYARIYAIPRSQIKQRIDWVIEMAGLQGVEDHLAGKLAMGIRQRLALGCALVHQPRVLFLDEPTSGVDPVGRRRFWDILVQMALTEQVAILVTTHYMSEAEHCDHLALMHAGRIIVDATPDQMKQALEQDAGQLLEITTEQPLMALKILEQAGFEGVSLFGQRIHLFVRNPQQAHQQIKSLLMQQGISLLHLQYSHPSLEDVFVYRIMAQEKEVCSS